MESQKSLHRKRLRTLTAIEQQQAQGCLSAFMRSNHTATCLDDKTNNLNINQNNLQPQESFKSKILLQEDELRNRYESIQLVLVNQNQNLKMQAAFLASEARKSLKREKIQREDMRRLHELYQGAVEDLQHATQENLQIKKYVEDKINFLSNTMQLTSINDIVHQIRHFIKEFCQFFQITLEQNISRAQNLQADINQNLESNRSKIEELNDKFEALMYEYRSSNQPQLRKKCIEIAKEIKQLKQREVINCSTEQILDSSIKNISRKQSKVKLLVSKPPLTPTVGEESLPFIHSLEGDHQEPSYNYDEQYPQRRTPQRKTMNDQRNNSSSLLKNSSYLKSSKAD